MDDTNLLLYVFLHILNFKKICYHKRITHVFLVSFSCLSLPLSTAPLRLPIHKAAPSEGRVKGCNLTVLQY